MSWTVGLMDLDPRAGLALDLRDGLATPTDEDTSSTDRLNLTSQAVGNLGKVWRGFFQIGGGRVLSTLSIVASALSENFFAPAKTRDRPSTSGVILWNRDTPKLSHSGGWTDHVRRNLLSITDP